MTAAAATFHLIAVPSALVDRRALSQAWYDALHLAERTPAARLRGPRSFESDAPARVRSDRARAERTPLAVRNRAPRAPRAPLTIRRAEPHLGGRVRDRRAGPSRLARRIVAQIQREPARASFTLRTTFGRVHLCVRRERGVLRLVALCSSPARAAVDRALAHARFALAAAGLVVE